MQENQSKDQNTTDLDGHTAFKMNCVILTKEQVQGWVDNGWTSPGNPNRIKKILLQHYSADATYVINNLQLIAYPVSGFRNVQTECMATLSIDTTCEAQTISGPVVFANNSISFDGLRITNEDGSLNDFDFIMLRPAHRYPPYINFHVEIVRNGVTVGILAK